MPKTDSSLFVGRTFRLLKDVVLEASHGETVFLKAKNGPSRELRLGRPVFPMRMLANHDDPHGGYGGLAKGTILEVVSMMNAFGYASDSIREVTLLVHGSIVLVNAQIRRNKQDNWEVIPWNAEESSEKWSEETKGATGQWGLKTFNLIQETVRDKYKKENKERREKGAPLLEGEKLDLSEYVSKPKK